MALEPINWETSNVVIVDVTHAKNRKNHSWAVFDRSGYCLGHVRWSVNVSEYVLECHQSELRWALLPDISFFLHLQTDLRKGISK